MLEKLLTIYDTRKQLEDELKVKRTTFEESIALDKATVNDLIDKENELREEALLLLEKENKEKIEVNGKVIIRQMKQTKQYVDLGALQDAIENPSIFEPLGYEASQILEGFQEIIEVKDKKLVKEIIDKHEKITGELLDGVELKTTKYIMIRDK